MLKLFLHASLHVESGYKIGIHLATPSKPIEISKWRIGYICTSLYQDSRDRQVVLHILKIFKLDFYLRVHENGPQASFPFLQELLVRLVQCEPLIRSVELDEWLLLHTSY